MRFIFRCVFWGFIALLVLPSVVQVPDGGAITQTEKVPATSAATQESFTTLDAMNMAVSVAGYIKNVCTHDEKLCENGGRLAEAAIARAKQGALVVADMVETHRSEMREANDPTTTSSIK